MESFANADKTKTWCTYEGPSEDAIRKAAELNGLPIDRMMHVPVTAGRPAVRVSGAPAGGPGQIEDGGEARNRTRVRFPSQIVTPGP